MKTKKQIALNKLFNFCIIVSVLFGFISVELFLEKELAWGLGFSVVTLIILFAALIFTPFCYLFDTEGLSLCYVFLPTERYLWKNIRSIEVDYISIGHHASFLDLVYASIFSISGKPSGKRRFYMEGHIRKSFRTKYLLEKYWDGTVTGYFFDDIKKSIKKHRDKQNKQTKVHLADEIIPIERKVRAVCRELLEPYIAKAKQCNLVLKPSYIYITEDFKELRSRPDEDYTYTLLMEISHPHETNENRIVLVSVDLIYVRLGKTAYKGILNENSAQELNETLSDVLNEIKINGIEVYCRNN